MTSTSQASADIPLDENNKVDPLFLTKSLDIWDTKYDKRNTQYKNYSFVII